MSAPQRNRHALIPVVMLVILTTSLGLASWFTTARNRQWDLPLVEVTFDPLHLGIPTDWIRRPDPVDFHNLGRAAAFTADDESDRTLFVIPLNAPANAHPLVVFVAVRQNLLSQHKYTRFTTYYNNTIRLNTLIGMLQAGVTSGSHGARHHFIALLTDGDRRYWALYLTAPTQSGKPTPPREIDLHLFQAICQSAQLVESSESIP